MSSLHGQVSTRPEPYEVRLRMAGRTDDRKAAHAIGFEVRALHMHGPGGAGGACEPRVRDVLAVKAALLPKSMRNAQGSREGPPRASPATTSPIRAPPTSEPPRSFRPSATRPGIRGCVS